MKVLIMHTLPPDRCDDGRWEWEFDLGGTAQELKDVLPDATVVGVRGEPGEIIDAVLREAPAVVFNLCEAPLVDPRLEAHAAALFEWLRVPFTGSPSTTLALCRRKDLTKQLLSAAGVPVPRPDRLPCIVKPQDEDGSAGVRADSVCESAEAVVHAIARVNGVALAEEFLPGREFVATLWGAREPDHVVVGEIAFSGGVRVISYEGKWDMESYDYLNAPLVFDRPIDPALQARLVDIASAAWRVLGLRGYGTIDIRLDADGEPRIIDVNPNAALNYEGRIHRAVTASANSWAAFINQQLEWAR